MKEKDQKEMLELLREQKIELENKKDTSRSTKRLGAGVSITAFWCAILLPFAQGTFSDNDISTLQTVSVCAIFVGLAIYGLGYLMGDH